MNASDIKNFVFSKSAVGGYKVSDVKGCLKEISEYVLNLEEKIYKLDRENKALKVKLLEAEKTQDEIKEIMISAQDFKHKILKEAEDKTNELVFQAQEKAKAIESDAQTKSDEQIKQANKELELKKIQLEELQKKVSDFKLKLMEIYKAHIDLITRLPEINETQIVNDANKGEVLNVNDESEAFENLQNSDNNLGTKNGSNVRVQRNLSGSENIFKYGVFGKNFSDKESSKKRDYIKSRFEELEI